MVRTVPTRRWWMRYLSLRAWGGAAAGLLVLGVGASLAQTPIVIQRAPRPELGAAAGNPSQPPTSPPPAPAPPSLPPSSPLPAPNAPGYPPLTPAPPPAVMPEPVLQLAPPPAPDPAPAAPPARQTANLPELPEPFTPPLPSKPNTPAAPPPTLALPPLPSTPVPATTPAPASLAVENPGWATKPAQNTNPTPVPPPLPSGMSPTPTAARTDKVSAPPPEAMPAAKLPPGPGPVPLPAEAAPVLPPAPRLAAEPTPVASAEVQKEYGQFVKSMIDPQTTLDLVAGRPRVMVLADAPKRVQVGDEKVLGFESLPPNELALKPRGVGTTVLNLWFPDPADKNKDNILSYLVRVFPDPQAKERLRGSCQTLADEINRAFPESRVTLFPVGDKLAVAGQTRDVAQAEQILQTVRAHVPDVGTPGLIVLITPELVHPTGCRDAAPVAGGDLIEPSDVEFYLTGRLRARLDPAQRKHFRHCEDELLAGPQGYSDGR